MSAIPQVIPPALPVAHNNATTLLTAIARAASDPQVDIGKMERLMDMHERLVMREAEAAFNEAMTACQREMRAVAADADNPQTRSRYATYAQLDRALRPIYTAHGLNISYNTADSPKADHIRVLAYVGHAKGHTRTYQIDMPADGKGAKGGDVMTKTHATGAAMSYGERYLLKGIFNVRIGEEDDDGQGDPNQIERAKAALTAEAAKGMKALHRAWADLPPAIKVSLKDMKEALKAKAAEVDEGTK